jgi:hypothetical protein
MLKQRLLFKVIQKYFNYFDTLLQHSVEPQTLPVVISSRVPRVLARLTPWTLVSQRGTTHPARWHAEGMVNSSQEVAPNVLQNLVP